MLSCHAELISVSFGEHNTMQPTLSPSVISMSGDGNKHWGEEKSSASCGLICQA